MSLNSSLAQFARGHTRKVRPLYRLLSRLHHRIIAFREWRGLRQYHPGVELVRYSARELAAQHETGYRSQFGQDYFLVASGLLPAKPGRFIEIGCNDPELASNTWFLERYRGWAGLAIDPLTQLSSAWSARRPRSTFLAEFVSVRDQTVTFAEAAGSEGWESMLSGAEESVSLQGKNVSVATRPVQPRTLQSILDQAGWSFGVEVMFVDVEGHEEEVLKSCTWDGPKPGVLVIENTGTARQQGQLRKFVEALGYRLVARVSIYDDIFQAVERDGQLE